MKDAYYFSHDCNARNDPKILKIRSKYGNEGYALYFMIIEMLRESKSYRLPSDWLAIAYGVSSDATTIEDIATNFDLFEFDENEFYSPSLMNRMGALEAKREKCKEAGRLGGLAKAKRTLSERSSDPLPVKESKVKESKVKNKGIGKSILFQKPTIQQIKEYCLIRKNSVDEQRFFDHYESNGWLVGKNKMKSWQAAIRTWEKNNFNKGTKNGQQTSKNVGINDIREACEEAFGKEELYGNDGTNNNIIS